MEPILEVKNLTKVFKREGQPPLTAVDHVSFSLFPGECLGVIGESGSGKSTVANMITRLTEATEGEIRLDGEDITQATGKKLRLAYRKMQMVFSDAGRVLRPAPYAGRRHRGKSAKHRPDPLRGCRRGCRPSPTMRTFAGIFVALSP